MVTWVHDGDKVTFEGAPAKGGPPPSPPKLRLWHSSGDWEAIVLIHDDGREEVLYEHHCADSEHWQDVIERVFGVKVEDVNMDNAFPDGEWRRYHDIDPETRKMFNDDPKLSERPLTFMAPHLHYAVEGGKADELGLPETLHHGHEYADKHHGHYEVGYGPAR
jgi:hypothetical protein